MERNEEQGPAGGVTAHLTVRDNRAAEAVEFYKNAFGAETAMDPFMADDGKRIPLDVKSGDRSLFGTDSGNDVKIDGDDYLILREEDVLAILE